MLQGSDLTRPAMSRLQITRTRSNDAPTSVFNANAGYSLGGDSSPDILQRDFLSRLENDNSLTMEIFGLDSQEIAIDNFAENQFFGSAAKDLSSERKSSGGLFRSISSADGRTIRLKSGLNGHGMDQTNCQNRRFHRHARDVSLAVPGSRSQWSLAKSDPTLSGTPPSQVLKFSEQLYSAQTDFSTLIDGHPYISNGRSYQNDSFDETYSFDKRTEAMAEVDFDNRYTSVQQFYELSSDSMQQLDYPRFHTNQPPIPECFDTMQDIDEFYAEDLTQTKLSTVTSGGSSESTRSAESPVSPTIEHVCLTSVTNGGENIMTDFDNVSPPATYNNDASEFSQDSSTYETLSRSNEFSPFVKFESGVCASNLTTSPRYLSGEQQQLLSEPMSLCDSSESSNSNHELQKEQHQIFRSPRPRIISNFCPKEQKKRRKFCRRKPPTLISHQKLERFNDDDAAVTISRSALVKPNSMEIDNLERKLLSAYHSDKNENDPKNHILVTISHEKRHSSMPDSSDIFDDSTNPPVQINQIPATTNMPCPIPFVPKDKTTKLTYFQNAMKEVLAEVDRTKDGDILEITTDESESCYESMKNFWREAKPTTVNQMCSLATGNFRSLGQQVNTRRRNIHSLR